MSLAEERREDAGCGASPCAIAANDRELEHINAQALSSGVGPLRSVELVWREALTSGMGEELGRYATAHEKASPSELRTRRSRSCLRLKVSQDLHETDHVGRIKDALNTIVVEIRKRAFVE